MRRTDQLAVRVLSVLASLASSWLMIWMTGGGGKPEVGVVGGVLNLSQPRMFLTALKTAGTSSGVTVSMVMVGASEAQSLES